MKESICIIIHICALILMLFVADNYNESRRLENEGVEVNAVITKIDTKGDKANTDFNVYITYAYGGEIYSNIYYSKYDTAPQQGDAISVKIDPENPLNVQNRRETLVAQIAGVMLLGIVGILGFGNFVCTGILESKREELWQQLYNTTCLSTESVKKDIREENKNVRFYTRLFAAILAVLMLVGACAGIFWIKNMTLGIMISSLYGITLLFSLSTIPLVQKCEKIIIIKTEIKKVATDEDGKLWKMFLKNGFEWKPRENALVGFEGIDWSLYEHKCDMTIYIAINEKRRIHRVFNGNKYVNNC